MILIRYLFNECLDDATSIKVKLLLILLYERKTLEFYKNNVKILLNSN